MVPKEGVNDGVREVSLEQHQPWEANAAEKVRWMMWNEQSEVGD